MYNNGLLYHQVHAEQRLQLLPLAYTCDSELSNRPVSPSCRPQIYILEPIVNVYFVNKCQQHKIVTLTLEHEMHYQMHSPPPINIK